MSDEDSFEALIARIRAGDHRAAEELVRLYEPLVRRELRVKMSSRRLGRVVDSVDICQSVWSSFFVRVAAGQYDLENPQQLARLLISMARNKLASQTRRQTSQKRDVSRMDFDGELLSSIPNRDSSPSTQLKVNELLDLIHEKLSDDERKVSELRRTGLTWEAVAEILGGTAQARRMQLDRAAERVIGQLGLNE